MSTFPYETKRIDEGVIPDPRILLQVQTRKGYIDIKFLVDTGADVTTLPIHRYARIFGYDKNMKEKITIGGVEGIGVAAYPFSLQIRLEKKEFALRCYFIESPIEPLLGRLDFWNLFSLSFDNQRLQTVITAI